MLYEEVIEVSERVILQDTTCQMEKKPGIPVVTGTTGEKVSDWGGGGGRGRGGGEVSERIIL